MRAYSIFYSLVIALLSSAAVAKPVKIVAFGDSLTAGYGLQAKEAFSTVLEEKLKQAGHDAQVLNHGVSGETTGQGLRRIDRVLAERPDIVIVELGANDMLRGLPVAQAKDNLDAILARLREAGIYTLLTGMRAPIQRGLQYSSQFNAIFEDLADKHDVQLYPFFLEGVAEKHEYNLPDHVHPNAQGVQVIVEGIYPYVEKMVERKED